MLSASFALGQPLYCGGTGNSNTGLYTTLARKGAHSPIVGYCTHVPQGTEVWLGVASAL